MRVLLIKPCWGYPITRRESTYNRIWPPLELANCAALLEEDGHEVEILDAHADRVPAADLAPRVAGFDRIFVTSSPLDRWQCPNLEIAPFVQTVRQALRATPQVFVLGYHGTVYPREVLHLTGARGVIRGEPELTVRALCRGQGPDGRKGGGPGRDQGGEQGLAQIRGLTFKQGGEVISTPDPPWLDLQELPVPSFHLLPARKYRYEVLGGNFFLLEASRGCPYPCTFCSRVMYGKRIRSKGLPQLTRELERAIHKHGVESAYFIDLEFTANRSLVMGLCRVIIERGFNLRWCCQTRADQVDEELLATMRSAGCELIHFGVESGSQRVLDLMKKGITLEQVQRGVNLAGRAGIRTLCFFMFGTPGEERWEMRQTVRFAKRLNPTYAAFHVATPYPLTPQALTTPATVGAPDRFGVTLDEGQPDEGQLDEGQPGEGQLGEGQLGEGQPGAAPAGLTLRGRPPDLARPGIPPPFPDGPGVSPGCAAGAEPAPCADGPPGPSPGYSYLANHDADRPLLADHASAVLTATQLRRLVRWGLFSFYLRPRYLWSRLRGGGLSSLWQEVLLYWGYARRR